MSGVVRGFEEDGSSQWREERRENRILLFSLEEWEGRTHL